MSVDFANADFIECAFDNCSFVRCTTEHAFFSRTQISAEAFMQGLVCPSYNHGAFDAKQHAELEREWMNVRARVAASISTGTEGISTELADEALYVARRTDSELRASTSWARYLLLMPRRAVIWLTKGGTSLWRLVAVVAASPLLAPVFLQYLGCTYEKLPIHFATPKEYVTLALRANGLVLAYAPDPFAATTLAGELLLAVVPSLGILWIAVVLAVLVRRVYR
jgi:hypothetical protein